MRFKAGDVIVAGREAEDPNLWQALLDAGAARSLVSDDAPALVAWMANQPQ